jgi:hypothetical protein
MRSRGKLLLVSQSLGVPDYQRAPGGPATVSGVTAGCLVVD